MTANYPGSDGDLEAAALLREHLREVLGIAEGMDTILRLLIDQFDGLEPDVEWRRAHRILLTRIADDLRAAAGLVLRGYFPQAHALGASVYELAYTAAYIGQSSVRATKWLEWESPYETPWKIRVMEAEVRSNTYEEDSDGKDARYMALCWGKHGNPQLQKHAGFAATPEAHVLNVDPELGGKAHRLGEIALWLMLEPVLTYLLSCLKQQLLPEEAVVGMGDWLTQWKPFDARMWSPIRSQGE